MGLREQTNAIQWFIRNHENPWKISEKDIHNFYSEIIDCLIDHNHQYYIENSPIISDKEYDQIFAYLKKIEEHFPQFITSNSPTQWLIGQISEWFLQAKHETKLLSLENTYNAKDLEERNERIYKILEKNNKVKNIDKEDLVCGTGIILKSQEGTYIFQRRDTNTKKRPWKIALFGWGTEENESHQDGILREYEEELGGKIHKKNMIEIGNIQSFSSESKYFKIFYSSDIDATQLTIHEWECMEIMSLEDAEKNPDVTPFTKEVITYFKQTYTITYTVEPKFDGLSVELIYKKWIFSQAITRGDGLVGEDITENVRTIKNVPKKLNLSIDIRIRWEILMPKSVWKDINKEREDDGDIPFANTRNAAAGSIKLLDPKEVAKRGLVCYVYDILTTPTINNQTSNLTELGLPVFPRTKEVHTIQEVISLCEDYETKKYLEQQDNEFDGLVIKVKEENQRKIIWTTDHHPRWAVAYKFPAQLAATQILSIDFQVGRTWIITPVANLEPVQLSGAKLQRVSLHNFDFIKGKDIRINDWIWLQRSGEVIPYIVSVITDRRTGQETEIVPPEHCPSCKEPVTNSDMHYYCTNIHCPEKTKQEIQHFVSKNCMDIQGIGESIVDILVDNKIIENVADIYRLTDPTLQMQLRRFPWFGDKKVSEIAKGIEESKQKPLRRLLNGLGITHVGKKMAQDLAEAMSNEQWAMNDEENIKTITNEEFLRSIYGIGEKTVENIKEFFHDKNNLEIINQLKAYGVNINPQKYTDNSKSTQLKWSFSITWSFDIPREKITDLLQQEGYIFNEQPTKTTDFILIGEKAGSKKAKAQELWIVMYEWRDTIIQQFPFLKNNSKKATQAKIQSLF